MNALAPNRFLPMLTLRQNHNSISVSGRTRLIKDDLLFLKGAWDYETAEWTLPNTYDLSSLSQHLSVILRKKQEEAEVQHQYTLLYARLGHKPSWVCCEHATVLSVVDKKVNCWFHY